jgi:hypothetical protein
MMMMMMFINEELGKDEDKPRRNGTDGRGSGHERLEVLSSHEMNPRLFTIRK